MISSRRVAHFDEQPFAGKVAAGGTKVEVKLWSSVSVEAARVKLLQMRLCKWSKIYNLNSLPLPSPFFSIQWRNIFDSSLALSLYLSPLSIALTPSLSLLKFYSFSLDCFNALSLGRILCVSISFSLCMSLFLIPSISFSLSLYLFRSISFFSRTVQSLSLKIGKKRKCAKRFNKESIHRETGFLRNLTSISPALALFAKIWPVKTKRVHS